MSAFKNGYDLTGALWIAILIQYRYGLPKVYDKLRCSYNRVLPMPKIMELKRLKVVSLEKLAVFSVLDVL